MTEIEDTIKILNKIGKQEPPSPYSRMDLTWRVWLSEKNDKTMRVGLRNDVFWAGYSDVYFDGFKLLEALGNYPDLASKMAEPA